MRYIYIFSLFTVLFFTKVHAYEIKGVTNSCFPYALNEAEKYYNNNQYFEAIPFFQASKICLDVTILASQANQKRIYKKLEKALEFSNKSIHYRNIPASFKFVTEIVNGKKVTRQISSMGEKPKL